MELSKIYKIDSEDAMFSIKSSTITQIDKIVVIVSETRTLELEIENSKTKAKFIE